MPRQVKPDRVILSDHAYQRYLERAPVGNRSRSSLAGRIRACLRNQLPNGKMVYAGAIEIYISPEVSAVLVPDNGFWECVTILVKKFKGRNEMKVVMQEKPKPGRPGDIKRKKEAAVL